MLQGKKSVIEFVRGGELHRTVRWCSDVTLEIDVGLIKDHYEKAGARVIKVSMIESVEIEL